jgi:hypothetical protein
VGDRKGTSFPETDAVHRYRLSDATVRRGRQVHPSGHHFGTAALRRNVLRLAESTSIAHSHNRPIVHCLRTLSMNQTEPYNGKRYHRIPGHRVVLRLDSRRAKKEQ